MTEATTQQKRCNINYVFQTSLHSLKISKAKTRRFALKSGEIHKRNGHLGTPQKLTEQAEKIYTSMKDVNDRINKSDGCVHTVACMGLCVSPNQECTCLGLNRVSHPTPQSYVEVLTPST